jgi:hypothetical protein
MSREQFIKANRRLRGYFCLILLLTACAAIGLGLALTSWADARQWLRAHRGEGVVRLLVGLLVEVVILGPLFLLPWLSLMWLDRRFGLRCPGCKRSITLLSRYSEVLHSGRCPRCHQTLFEEEKNDCGQ